MAMAQAHGAGAGWCAWRGWWMARLDRRAEPVGAHDEPRAGPMVVVDDFEPFVRRYERAVLNYLWRMLADEAAAYDLCQEVFVRAWQHYATIQTYEQPLSWLLRVGTNLALNYRQRRAAPVGAAIPLDEMNDPGRSDPATQVVEHELVRGLLAQLPPKRRAALILHEVYGLPCAEVAVLLGMTLDAVKMALSRARAQFRALYLRAEGQP